MWMDTDLYTSPNITRVVKSRWAGDVARMEGRSDAYRVSVEKADGKRPIVRSRGRWDINPLALELDIYSLAHNLCKM